MAAAAGLQWIREMDESGEFLPSSGFLMGLLLTNRYPEYARALYESLPHPTEDALDELREWVESLPIEAR